VQHVEVVDAGAGKRGHLGELTPVVNPQGDRRVRHRVCRDAATVAAQDRQHVGEVELGLGVVGAEARKRVEQLAALERVDADIDLADGQLGL
jgi:hypothetical protein